MRAAWLLAVALLAIGLAACEAADDPRAPLQVYVDGELALSLAARDVEAPMDLIAAAGLAQDAVRFVELRADGAAPVRVLEPAQRFPARTLAAFRVDAGGGAVGVGFVDHVLGALPAAVSGPPPLGFAAAVEVRLRTDDVTALASERRVALTVVVDGVELRYDERALKELPRDGPQRLLGLGGGRNSTAGVPIASVVADALRRAGDEHGVTGELAAVTLEAGAEELVLTRAELSEGSARVAMIKRNRKGQWRVRLYTAADGALTTEEGLRGVTRITATLL